MRNKKPKEQQILALERIMLLFEKAEQVQKAKPALSRRYIQMARKIGLRYTIRLPKPLKRRFCKNCNTLLSASAARRRLTPKKTIVVTCLYCKTVKRYSYGAAPKQH